MPRMTKDAAHAIAIAAMEAKAVEDRQFIRQCGVQYRVTIGNGHTVTAFGDTPESARYKCLKLARDAYRGGLLTL